MRKRDFFIFLVCGLGLFWILQQEGNVSLEKAFILPHRQPAAGIDSLIHELQEHEVVGENDAQMSLDYGPKPIIADVDGDGYNELIVGTRIDEGKTPLIRIYSLKKFVNRPRYVAQDFTGLALQRKISFASRRKAVLMILGLSSGYLTKTDKNQIICAAFSNWRIACFDHMLKVLWEGPLLQEHDLKEAFAHNEIPSEVVITIVPYPIHTGDQGIVIVGLRKQNAGNVAHGHKHANDKFEESSHYSYYAFEGLSGAFRWKHESKDNQAEETESLQEQHSFKIDVKQHTQHSGEVHWRTYQDDILRHLPHLYRHPHNTQLIPDHFVPSSRKKATTQSQKDKSDYGEIRERFVDTFHRIRTSRQKAPSEKAAVPNVFVAHLARGIEIVHLYTGRTLCQVSPLKKYVTYADLTNDATIDGAAVTSAQEKSGMCTAIIESGAPSVTEVLFKAQVCDIPTALSQFAFQIITETSSETGTIQSLPPAILDRHEGNRHVHDAVYLSSTGLATSLTFDHSSGEFRVKWQSLTLSSWSSGKKNEDGDIDRDREVDDLVFPDIVAYALRADEHYSFAIALGESIMSVLDSHGTIQHVERLPHHPSQPIILADLNGDNVNDIIVPTNEGYYGYIVRTHSGTSVLSVLVLGMLVVIGVLYLSTFIDLKDETVQKRPDLKQA